MIIKGNPAGSVKFWSKHLLRDDTNERAEIKEITGLLSEDLPSALREMKAIADQSRCRGNFMYQANINPRDDEHLTPEQWKEAVDTLEKNLGLEGHQRVVIEHVKHGRQHYHVVWNRVDVDTLRVADMGGNWPIHDATSRELEARFGLTPTPTPNPEQAAERKRAVELYEIRAAERSGIDPVKLKAELTELWNRSDNGAAFKAAIEERGYILAKGDRRDFCVVDQAGDAHSLARRLDGVRAKDVRERMADVRRESLPTVADARETQHQRHPEVQARIEALKQLKAADRADRTTLREADNKQFWRERREKMDAGLEARTEKWERKAKAERARIDPVDLKGATTKTALVVVDVASGAADTLVSFVDYLLGGGHSARREPGFDDSTGQLQAQRRALAAIERIRESIEAGENLRPADVQNLTPTHLENIRLRGDDYVRQLVDAARRQREHEREDDWGRTRER